MATYQETDTGEFNFVSLTIRDGGISIDDSEIPFSVYDNMGEP